MFQDYSKNQKKVAAFLGFGEAVQNPERIPAAMMERVGKYLPSSAKDKTPGQIFEQQWNQWEGQIRRDGMGCPDDIKPEQWKILVSHVGRIGRVKYVEPASLKDMSKEIAAIRADLLRD